MPNAGLTLRAAYTMRHDAWIAQRRRIAALSALWWAPTIVALGVVIGASTHVATFGMVFAVLAVWAVLDVLFRKPDRLVRVRERAAAESGTGRFLRAVEIRGGVTVLHDRLLAAVADPFETEHVVLSPRGVFLIGSRQWHGHAVRMAGPDIYVDHVDQKPMLRKLAEQARILGDALGAVTARDEEVGVVAVTPLLVVHAHNLYSTARTVQGVVVVTPPQLATALRAPDIRWSPRAVTSLVEAANLLLIQRDKLGSILLRQD